MESHLSDIVVSLCGRDKGQLLLVVGEEGPFLFVANGKQRRAEQPKRKKLRHVRVVGSSDAFTRDKLLEAGRLNNGDIRRALDLWEESAAQEQN